MKALLPLWEIRRATVPLTRIYTKAVFCFELYHTYVARHFILLNKVTVAHLYTFYCGQSFVINKELIYIFDEFPGYSAV